MFKVIILILVGMFSTHATAEPKVLYHHQNGFAVENVVEINAPIEQVWKALIKDVDTWWPKDHTWWGVDGKLEIEPIAGGCFCEIAGERSAAHMTVAFVDPQKLLRMTGGLGPLQGMGMYGALDWQLKTVNGKVEVTLTYKVNGYLDGGFEQLAPIVAKVQGMQLNGLAQFTNAQ